MGSSDNRRFLLRNNGHRAKQNRFAIDRLPESSAALYDRLAVLPVDFLAATPKCVAPWLREAGATSEWQPARSRENACCAGNEKAPPFPSS